MVLGQNGKFQKKIFRQGKTCIMERQGGIASQPFSSLTFCETKISMESDQRTAIMISRQAMEFLAANGGHATLYLVPRPAADG